MREQLLALLLLRLALFRNSGRRRAVSTVMSVLVFVTVTALSCLLALGLFALAAFGPMADRPNGMVLVVVDILVALQLFFWAMWLFGELQRSDVIDLRRMLYLPVSLRMVFALNFIGSLVTPVSVFFLLPLTGLVLGLTVSCGVRMLLGLPLVAAFLFMLSAWTYYAQGLLAILLENKRRRRTVLTLVTTGFVLLAQAPNLLGMAGVYSRRSPPGRGAPAAWTTSMAVDVAHRVFPPAWLPVSLAALARGEAGPAGLGFLGMTGLGAAGLLLAYRSTVRYYRGAARSTVRRPGPAAGPSPAGAAVRPARRVWTAWEPRFVPPEVSAVASGAFLCVWRHPQFRVQCIMPLIVAAVLLGSLSMQMPKGALGEARALVQGLVPMGVSLLAFLGFGPFTFNQFGVDRDGFRSYMLSPVSRASILAGKNLALAPVVLGIGMTYVLAGALLMRTPVTVVLGQWLLLGALYLLSCAAGNVVSVLFPYPVRGDAMRGGPRWTPAALANVLLSLILLAVAVVPVALGLLGDYLLAHYCGVHTVSVLLPVGALLCALAGLLYAAVLGPTGRLLARREPDILARVVRAEH